MGKYFGTDGFRGEAGVAITYDHAVKIGRFLGWYYATKSNSKARVVIGKDTRRSSYMLEYALVAGLTASGADAYLMHVTTTPSVSYITKIDEFDCGIMISASHNPFYDNGIKLINGAGEKMEEEVIAEIENYLDHPVELPLAKREEIGCTVDYFSGRNRYIGYLLSLATKSYKGKKVGLDCSNGASWQIAKPVFDALGAETHVIHAEPNGLNINDQCGSTHIEELQQYVVEKGLDVGFAFDGDADRCIAVDEKGNVIDGDLILYCYGCYLKEHGDLAGNTVVTTMMSNMGVVKAFEERGILVSQTDVGDKNVYDRMVQGGYCIGGELTGHIIFSKYATTGDGVLTSILLMEVMLSKKEPLSKLCEPVTFYPHVQKNVRVADKKAALENPAVTEQIATVTKALGDRGRIIVRESGTEPVLRVMVEADDENLCVTYVDSIVSVIMSNE